MQRGEEQAALQSGRKPSAAVSRLRVLETDEAVTPASGRRPVRCF